MRVKKILKSSRRAIAVAVGLLGFSFLVQSLASVFPSSLSPLVYFVIGIGLVILSGFLLDLRVFK